MPKITLGIARNAVVSNLRQYSEGAKARARQVVVQSAERVNNTIAGLCPFDVQELDDFHMLDHIELEFTPDGLGYNCGFKASTFAKFNQPPYFWFTEYGTIYMDAQPCVGPAENAEAKIFPRELAKALRPQPGDRR